MIFMGYKISMKMNIIGFNKPMIPISWRFYHDCAHALHVTD